MKHFITFQKSKGIHVVPSSSSRDSSNLVHQINHELMSVGYVMDRELFETLSTQKSKVLEDVYSQVVRGIKRVVPQGTFEPIYRNFPQSVMSMSHSEFVFNALTHYWSMGSWRPEDSGYLNRELKVEVVNYKKVTLLSYPKYLSIFSNILNSGASISGFDKECVDFYLDNHSSDVNLSKIKFKETLAYVGKRLIESEGSLSLSDNKEPVLPTKNATDILRIYAAYSGGDEGLKENTRFKKLKSSQRRLFRNSLDNCYNLEDSFKTYREQWLRVLFYLNPRQYTDRYPNLGIFSEALRNSPESLETFNAKVERFIREKDTSIFDLLEKRAGVFTRRLDHLVRVFGKTAIQRYISLENINFTNLVTAYNHFDGRDKEQVGRGAILASQSSSSLVTYEALAPLDSKLVIYIKGAIMNRLRDFKIDDNKKYFIDRSLYYTPIAQNNRASELSLDSKVIGESSIYKGKKTLRMYVHWEGRSDIDLSAFCIDSDNNVIKIGWNSRHTAGEYVVYSGDNTGLADKNAEYMDINVEEVPENIEWIITEARIYSGMRSFEDYNGKAHIGWMETNFPEENLHWQPKKLVNSRVLTSKSRNVYMMAYHPKTKSVVYLDMEIGSSSVSGSGDALKMRMFLESFVSLDDGKSVSWDKLNQGHLLELRFPNTVSDLNVADVVFDKNTSVDEISTLITS